MMLVNHHAIKAGLAAVLQLIEVHAIQLLGPFGAKMLVRKHQVVVAMLSSLALWIRRVPHFGEEVDFLDHVGPPTPERWLMQPGPGQVCWTFQAPQGAVRKSRTTCTNSVGFSISGMWPHLSRICAVAPGWRAHRAGRRSVE